MPADFIFPADKALSTVCDSDTIVVMLVPTSGMDTKEGQASPQASLSIQAISLGLDPAMPQPPRDEQEELRRQEENG